MSKRLTWEERRKAKCDAEATKWARIRGYTTSGTIIALMVTLQQLLHDDETVQTRGDIALEEIRSINAYLHNVLRDAGVAP